mmetsp:Transcript_53213/g.124059  ORF Transcript_53213/g.124059 Transcript_53213/m.124059 type:complete len:252 (+) Transcript_53213:41-796(+)
MAKTLPFPQELLNLCHQHQVGNFQALPQKQRPTFHCRLVRLSSSLKVDVNGDGMARSGALMARGQAPRTGPADQVITAALAMLVGQEWVLPLVGLMTMHTPPIHLAAVIPSRKSKKRPQVPKHCQARCRCVLRSWRQRPQSMMSTLSTMTTSLIHFQRKKTSCRTCLPMQRTQDQQWMAQLPASWQSCATKMKMEAREKLLLSRPRRQTSGMNLSLKQTSVLPWRKSLEVSRCLSTRLQAARAASTPLVSC